MLYIKVDSLSLLLFTAREDWIPELSLNLRCVSKRFILDDDDELIFINSDGKQISIQNETDIYIENNLDVSKIFKDALLASLYAQTEFLKKEIEEKNIAIRTLLLKHTRMYSETSTSSSSDYCVISEYNGEIKCRRRCT